MKIIVNERTTEVFSPLAGKKANNYTFSQIEGPSYAIKRPSYTAEGPSYVIEGRAKRAVHLRKKKRGEGHGLSPLSFCDGRAALGCGLPHEEDAGEGYDGVELGEHGEDEGLAEDVVALGNAGDAVGADLTLTDGREEAHEAEGEAAAQHGGCLEGGDVGAEQAGHVGKDEVAGEAVQALRAREGGEDDEVTELVDLLEGADGGVARDGDAEGAADSRKSNHQGYAQIS